MTTPLSPIEKFQAAAVTKLKAMNLGYKFQMSDYAVGREDEAEYERAGLAEIDNVLSDLLAAALILAADIGSEAIGELIKSHPEPNLGIRLPNYLSNGEMANNDLIVTQRATLARLTQLEGK